ncbi:hypothetical protein OF83DRAFT_1142091 [Amylostereum chailletii]|nr:hypothetical protein OF83DRAFT_1142091 [Amylostereum chailletii]
MVHLVYGLLSTFAVSAGLAFPLHPRISQIEGDATSAWQAACKSAGGGSQCNNLAVIASGSLSSFSPICAQQDAADNMVDLAKQLNDPDTLSLAQIYVQQAHSSPDKSQFPFCQRAPKNPELNGLFHCQFSGSDFTKFSPSGNQTETIPLGLNAPVNPPGACPASPSGPVPDGKQLQTLVSSPGVPFNADGTSPTAMNSRISTNSTENATCSTPASQQQLASTIIVGQDELPPSLEGDVFPFPVLADDNHPTEG